MKNLARACLFGSIAAGAAAAMLLACQNGNFIGPWPLAPSGGSLADAGSGQGGTLADARATSDGNTDIEAGDSGANGGDSGDAGDGAPVVFPYPSVTIAAGNGFACYIDGQGNVWCWGNNTFGQAGSTPSATVVTQPQQVSGVSGATAIALGDYHACAVTSANAVYCWGLNNSYQLGHPPAGAGYGDVICPGSVANQTVACNPVPVAVDVAPAAAIAAAGAWTCIVETDGTVTCWGAAQAGQPDDGGISCGAGTAATGGSCYAGPYAVSGVSGVAQLAVAFDHACAVLLGDASVSCWGSNNEGQVSPQACQQSECTPLPQTSLPATTSVAVGTAFSCALAAEAGTVSCFGDNAYGELGHPPGTMGDPSPEAGAGVFNASPQAVVGLSAVAELVASGSQAACAIVGGGTVECWGNVASDAGPGIPVAISGLPAMTALGVPDDSYACGVSGDASVWCWSLASGAAPAQLP